MHDDWDDEPKRDRPGEIAVAAIAILVLGYFAGVAYVVGHFALKYW